MDAFDFLKSSHAPFQYIFLSPPFDVIHWHKLMRAIETASVFNNESIIIIQHPKKIDLVSFKLTKTDERQYGFNKLTFFKLKED